MRPVPKHSNASIMMAHPPRAIASSRGSNRLGVRLTLFRGAFLQTPFRLGNDQHPMGGKKMGMLQCERRLVAYQKLEAVDHENYCTLTPSNRIWNQLVAPG